MSLLSAPLTQMAAEYDAVVVGSGYGGSVSVATLARTRRQDGTPLRVALLERGFEIPVGQFPHGTAAALRQIQIEDRLGGFGHSGVLALLQGSGFGAATRTAVRPLRFRPHIHGESGAQLQVLRG